MTIELRRIDDRVWEIPKQGGMRVPGRIYASARQMADLAGDPCLQQVANVAHLPGIVGYSLAMPDIHWGYGFPIGGVAATRLDEGVVSPGGVGYDINCGVRLANTRLRFEDVRERIPDLVRGLFVTIPTGVGAKNAIGRLSRQDVRHVLKKGARWAIEQGYGEPADLEHTEEGGCLRSADADSVSDTAVERGTAQLGTLGSGNHFLEVQVVDHVVDEAAAGVMGLEKDMVCVMIHSGSRGLGYQVCDDALAMLRKAPGTCRSMCRKSAAIFSLFPDTKFVDPQALEFSMAGKNCSNHCHRTKAAAK